jgi:hypothetical protein
MWPQSVTISQLLRGANGIRPPETVLKDCTSEGTAPDPDGVSYARPPKVTKTEIFFKKELLHKCPDVSAFLASGKRQTHVFGQGLLFEQRQYNVQWYLTSV